MQSDIRVRETALYFLPVPTRVPLRFGGNTIKSVTCARVRVTVENSAGVAADGWGETPLSVPWIWNDHTPYKTREDALFELTELLTQAWQDHSLTGHPMEMAAVFLNEIMPGELQSFRHTSGLRVPGLAGIVCSSPVELATHDAYGILLGVPLYATYNADYMRYDLSRYFEEAPETARLFKRRFPEDYLVTTPPARIPAWHLVGALDPLSPECAPEAVVDPADGYPLYLTDWIERDGLRCLKVKLGGQEAEADGSRLIRVGEFGMPRGVTALSADFNCTAPSQEYVEEVLDRIRLDAPAVYKALLYVEQPFPADNSFYSRRVEHLARKKPLYMDESAESWQSVAHGAGLGWNGVALKTCKTQTGALLSYCWASEHEMPVMVQDLTNPMLAQLSHLQLAAHTRTLCGVETNSMQFYPDASLPESRVHPGAYTRSGGMVDISTMGGPGFGYDIERIERELPRTAGKTVRKAQV